MHIAIEASTWVNPRGYGRFTREVIRALLRAGSPHSFTLVLDSGAAAATDLPEVRTAIVRTRQSVSEAASAEGSRSIGDILRMTQRLSRGFDLVFFPTSYSFVPVLPGPRVVVVVHDAMPEVMPELVMPSRRARTLWNLKSRLVRQRASLVATVSKASAVEIGRHLRIAPDRLVVLTEGASAIFSPERRPDDERLVEGAVGGSFPFVLYVGGLSPHKRVPELIRAFGAVASRPEHARLRLVLAGPGERDTFAADRSGVAEALASIGPLAARVVLTGYVPDATLAALYRLAASVVLPSRMEGFGLPAVEAMASGAPLIAARTPALEELCGEAAAYLDDIADLPAVLSAVLADHHRANELRRLGPPRAAAFGWDEAARRLLAAFDRLC